MKRKLILGTIILLAVTAVGCGSFKKSRVVQHNDGVAIAIDPADAFFEDDSLDEENLNGDEAQSENSDDGGMGDNMMQNTLNELKEENLLNKYDKAGYFADAVYKMNHGENTLVSPLSLDMALGLASEGAKGKTKEELLDYLGYADYGEFAAKYMRYIDPAINNSTEADSEIEKETLSKENNESGSKYSKIFKLANSVWVNQEKTLKDSYKKNTEEKYHAQVENVDFGSGKDETVKTINDWCKEKTNNFIPHIINADGVDESMAAILVNALYFEAPWEKDWKLANDTFTEFDGKETEQEMLRDTLDVYFENEYATGFSKKYSNGMEFIGILPKTEEEFNISELDLESFMASKEVGTYDVMALMPKLNYETTADEVKNILMAQGVKTPFDQDNADFSEMIELEDGENIYISDIIQKCKIELDEGGTKAAAVTVIEARCTSALPMETKEVKFVLLNRPFAYMIYDSNKDQILFAGKVVSVE